jgi:hypothetical protein
MPLIIPSNSISAVGYDVANSLRFDDGSSDYLNRTPASAGNRKTFTISFWIKRANIVDARLISCHSANSDSGNFEIDFGSSNFRIVAWDTTFRVTNRVFRDPSAWYHFVTAVDTTQSTANDRIKIYVNGVQETSFSTLNNPSQNADTGFNQASTTRIGVASNSLNGHFDGYMTEVCFIDGQALDPTSFGEFDEDTGIWKPINVSGLTFGTNGFYLDFENSGSLGADVSGVGNNFTVNNLTSIDQTTDTPTNNYCTMNPLDNYYANSTFSNGNLSITTGSTEYSPNYSTIGVSQGKWYYECKLTADSYAGSGRIGVAGKLAVNNTSYLGSQTDQVSYAGSGAVLKNNASQSGTWSSYAVNDIINVAVDLDNNFIYFGKNGTWQNSGDPTSGGSGTGGVSLTTASSTSLGVYLFGASDNANNGSSGFDFNFGNPAFTISSGNSDGNGFGNFEYPPPSGYLALNTKNLAEYG